MYILPCSIQSLFIASFISRLYAKNTNVRFNDFINSFRIRKSISLVTDKNLSISEISFMCGFGSIRNFNRVFLAEFGCTPKEFRKSVKTLPMLQERNYNMTSTKSDMLSLSGVTSQQSATIFTPFPLASFNASANSGCVSLLGVKYLQFFICIIKNT